MAGIQGNRFSFFQQNSAWQELQARREKSKAHRENFEALSAEISATFSSASSEQITASGDLAAKAALKRINAEIKAKAKAEADKKAASNNSVWKNKPAANSVDAGGTKIDFMGNTIKLSDGTMLNIKTGKPAGNYLTLADGSQIDLDTGHKVINVNVTV